MTIEIHRPEIEALILQRMESGGFQDVKEVLLDALRSAPLPKKSDGIESSRHRSLEEVFAMVRGLGDDADFSRDQSTGHAVEIRENLAQFLLDSPLSGSGLEIERIKDLPGRVS